MADRYPLVVNPTTNQITEIQINDDLQLDDTELTTSTGNLLLNPAGDIDCQKDLSNSGGDLKIDDNLEVTGLTALGTTTVAQRLLNLGTTWNANSTHYGIHLNVTNTQSGVDSRLIQLQVGGSSVFDVDVSGDTNIVGTLNVDGIGTFQNDLILNADNKNFKIQLDNGTDKFTVASASGNTTIAGNLDVDGQTDLDVVNIANTLTLSADLDADSTANFQGEVTFQTGIVPDTDEGAYIGTASLPFSEVHAGEIQIAPGVNDNTIVTATGNLELSAAGATDKVVIQKQCTMNSPLADDNLRIVSTEGTAANSGPDLVLFRNSASAADDDFLGAVRFTANDDAGTPAEKLYARILAQATDISAGSENGKLILEVNNGGTVGPAITIDGSGTTIAGNLTVSGTTTTVNSTTLSVADAEIEIRKGNSLTAADGGIQVNLTTDGSGNVTASRKLQWNNTATAWQATDSSGTLRTLLTEGNPIKVISSIEDIDIHTPALTASELTSGDFFYDVIGRNVHWWGAGDATTDFVIDVRGSSTVTFANHCANGEAVTFTMLIKNGATARSCTGLKIDGTTQTIRWANATTPTPAANQRIVYTFTIMRHGTTSTSYEVLGSGTNYD